MSLWPWVDLAGQRLTSTSDEIKRFWNEVGTQGAKAKEPQTRTQRRSVEEVLESTGWSEAKTQRIRLYGCFCFAIPTILYFAWVRGPSLGPEALVAMSFNVVAIILCALLVWKYRATRLASHAYTLSVFVAITAPGFLSDSSYAMDLWIIPLVPLTAAFLLSLRAIIVYSVISLIPVICGYLAGTLVKSTLDHRTTDSDWLVVRVVVALAACSVGALLAYNNARGLRRLIEQSDRIKKQVHASRSDHRTKSAFLAQMSHEIRTPVHGILGMISHLKSLPMNLETASMVASMHECASSLSGLLTEILDLAKLESGRVELHYSKVDLRDLVLDLVERFKAPAQAAGLEIEACVPHEALWAWIDAQRTRQVIVPLIENAIKFSSSGVIEVSLCERSCPNSDGDDLCFEVAVVDQGVGLSIEQQSMIFEHFEQFHDEFVKEKGGVGLGLTLVSRLVKLLGGEIEVHSRQGEGSQFVVRFSASAQNLELPVSAHPRQYGSPGALVIEPGSQLVVNDALGQQSESVYRRQRLVLFHRVFIPALLYYSVDCFLVDQIEQFVVILGALAFVLISMWMIRKELSFRTHSWVFVGASSLFIFTISAFDGQLQADTLWLLPLTPIMAVFLLGLRAFAPAMGIFTSILAATGVLETYWNIPATRVETSGDSLVYRMVYSLLFSAVAVAAAAVAKRQQESLRLRQKEWEKLRFQAERANEAKSKFLANMSHEIRTPMNGVLGLAQNLLAQDLPDEQRSALATIHRSGGHLLVLLNEILDSTRVESEEITVAKISFDLCELVRDVQRLFASRAEQKGLEVRCAFDGSKTLAVVGDPTRIMQVLANLVGNGIKFSDAGVIRLELSTLSGQPSAESRVQVQVVVRDQGIGMTPEQLERIFDEYVQVDEDGENQRGGTGLGLAISRRLAIAMGGSLTADSVVGQGSTFTFGLCLLRDRRGCSRQRSKTSELNIAVRGRVLVVDDNPINRKVAALSLERMGCAVETANNGEEALERVQASPFHLVVMDVRMPVMDGMQATQEIRALGGRFLKLPIVALTADGFEETKQACIQAGMNDHLAKPFKASELKQMVQAYLAETASADEEAA